MVVFSLISALPSFSEMDREKGDWHRAAPFLLWPSATGSTEPVPFHASVFKFSYLFPQPGGDTPGERDTLGRDITGWQLLRSTGQMNRLLRWVALGAAVFAATLGAAATTCAAGTAATNALHFPLVATFVTFVFLLFEYVHTADCPAKGAASASSLAGLATFASTVTLCGVLAALPREAERGNADILAGDAPTVLLLLLDDTLRTTNGLTAALGRAAPLTHNRGDLVILNGRLHGFSGSSSSH
jgi:hypothetical protein